MTSKWSKSPVSLRVLFILVATQKDRRDEVKPADPGHITTAQGQKVAEDLNLSKFMETSALKDPEVTFSFHFILLK